MNGVDLLSTNTNHMSEVSIFENIPGMEASFDEAHLILSEMWNQSQGTDDTDVRHKRASQMNIILHFDASTSLDEANKCFSTLIELNKSYPCRAIVLCPKQDFEGNDPLKGKVFSECYLNTKQQASASCEILLLRYSSYDAQFLEYIISTWLENELPTYYWLYKVTNKDLYNYYISILKRCWGVVYDSAVEGCTYDHIPWPHPHVVCDLAYARLLPIRQMIGKCLSIYNPEHLIDGLKTVQVYYKPELLAETDNLILWFKSCLRKCTPNLNDIAAIEFKTIPLTGKNVSLKTDWVYSNDNSFEFTFQQEKQLGEISTSFNGKSNKHKGTVNLLDTVDSLAEAFFRYKKLDN